MTEHLNLGQIALLIAYAAGMAAGQLLFKAAALRLGGSHPLSARALLLLQDAPFIGAIVLYAALSVLWVWLLTFTPLSRAYPTASFLTKRRLLQCKITSTLTTYTAGQSFKRLARNYARR